MFGFEDEKRSWRLVVRIFLFKPLVLIYSPLKISVGRGVLTGVLVFVGVGV